MLMPFYAVIADYAAAMLLLLLDVAP